ncbi:TRAP transporter small permease [Pseudomonas lalucatii]|uniref:TRAP transporter small permease protein n=1 Tax=Pseudomonas lalucatii TaxID=1424203 RepID=A0ABS5Q6P1_9PSED|nr:TRAP transporter small permease [Pseudomonas lalucatii]MBS7725631.1 TRAP transporter small permease [Pseudomonas lalucatii]QVM88749.1 TRAP transporter small permease [Pseudomonas lalucatii]
MFKTIAKLNQLLITISHNIAALLLAISVFLVFYQVITRFIVGDSSTWTEVLARGLIIWCVFLSSAVCFRIGSMISIEIFVTRIPARFQISAHRLITCLTLMFLGVLIWYGWLMTLRVAGQDIAMLDISIAWFYAAIPVGASFALIAVMIRHFELEQKHRQG